MKNKKIDKQFTDLLDHMVEGIQIHDFDWRYVYVNDALTQYSRYPKEELIGYTIQEKYPGIDQTPVFKVMDKCLKERTNENCETEFIFPDGSVGYFELRMQPVGDGILIHSIDRSEEKKATDKLQKVNRLYAFNSAINQSIVHITDSQQLLENACVIATEIGGFENAWIDLFEPETNQWNRSVNKGIHSVKNRSQKKGEVEPLAQQVLASGSYALSNDIENDPIMDGVRDMLMSFGVKAQIDLPIRRKGNIIGVFGLQSSRRHFFDEQEIGLLLEAVGDISFALEIFEKNRLHQQTEQLVIDNEKRFRTLIEKSPDMKSLATAEGNFIYGSPSITKILGYPIEEFTRKSVFDLIHPDEVEKFRKKRNQLLSKPGASFEFQHRRLHKDGHWVWCEGTLTNWLNQSGIKAMVSNFRDITAKKIAEQQREFDTNNTFALINNTKDMMWSVDKELRLISSNHRFNEVVKMVRGQFIEPGEKILDGANPETAEMYHQFYLRALSGESFSEITKLTLPQKRWLEVSFFPIRQNGEVVGTACHSRDITEFKNLEVELQKNLREITDYKYALDESSIVAITDQKGIIRHVNENFCRISKYSREELIGQDHRMINSGYHSKAFIKELWTTIAQGKIWKGELKNKAKDGNYYWVDTTIVPFLNDKKKPYQYIAIRSDISERKKIEGQLRKSEEFSREVLNSLSAHIAVVDSLGQIVAVNEAWKKFGIENGAARYISSQEHRNYFEVCEKAYANGDLEAAEVLHGLKEVMAKRWPDFYHEYRCNSDREDRWFAMTTRPFQGEESMIVVAHDNISERKQAEEKLIRQNKELEKTNFELDRFVYSVSHDLRSPLTAILGLLSFIEEESNEPETLEHIKMIRERINHLDQFIKSILDYSRNNRLAPEMEHIDLAAFIANIVGSLSTIKEAENISFVLDLAEDQHFYSDPISLRTIIENLVSNAIKFYDPLKSQPYIGISATMDEHGLQLEISDNGIGVAAEHQQKIFEMFYRLSGHRSGSGIGLYIVKEIIEKLSGSISVKSEPGEGTVFTIRLKKLQP